MFFYLVRFGKIVNQKSVISLLDFYVEICFKLTKHSKFLSLQRNLEIRNTQMKVGSEINHQRIF